MSAQRNEGGRRAARGVGLTLGFVVAMMACKGGLDLDGERAFSCVRGATDVEDGACPEGLHCGVDGFCYSKSDPKNGDAGYACDPEGDDCVEGWFCGYDRFCHPGDVAAAYPCALDEHCVAPWRCGPDAVCVDPSTDALRADAPDVTFSEVKAFTPQHPWTKVDALAVAPTFSYVNGGRAARVTPIAVADGAGLTSVLLTEDAFPGGVALPPRFAFTTTSLDGGAPVRELAAVDNHVFALQGAGLRWLEWSIPLVGDGGTSNPSPVLSDVQPPLPTVASRLRTTGAGDGALVAELAKHTYRLHSPNRRASGGPFTAPDAGVNGGEIDDLVDTGRNWLYASFGGVLHGATRVSVLGGAPGTVLEPTWWPARVKLDGQPGHLSDCNGVGDAGFSVREIHAFEETYSGSSIRIGLELSAGVASEKARGTHWGWLEGSSDDQCPGSVPEYRLLGPCAACGPGETLVEMGWGSRESDNGQMYASLKSECARPDGGVVGYSLGTDSGGSGCRRDTTESLGEPPAAAVRVRTNSSARGHAIGERVAVRTDLFQEPLPLSMSSAPEVVAQLEGRTVAMGNKTIFQEVPGFGLAMYNRSRGEDDFPVAVVENHPEWMIFGNGYVADTGRLDGSTDKGPPMVAIPQRGILEPPFTGTRAVTSDGRTMLVMSAFDALVAADMGPVLDGGASQVHLEVKTVPLSRIPILSMTVVPGTTSSGGGSTSTDAGTELLSGYVLTQNRLFAFRAQSDQRWDLRELNVPDGDWVEVWADGRRGRVGYRDGVVYSLPSRVKVAEALGGGKTVVDFIHFCQRSWALSQDGLYRLEASADSAVGAWVKQSLPVLDEVGGPWSKLYISHDKLFAFTRDGKGVQMKAASCPAP